MPKEQITIVGGHGFIGRALVKHYQKKGVSVRVPERGEMGWLDEMHTTLIWAAGYTADYLESPAQTIEAHAALVAQVVERKNYHSLVYLSSTRLYDGLSGRVDEDTPLALGVHTKRQLFDLSKGLGEWLVQHCGGPRAHIARLAGVYSDALDGGSFFESLVGRALAGKDGAVESAPNTCRDYVHIDDVCAAIEAIAARGNYPVYIVASGELVRNEVLLTLLSERTRTKLEAVHPPSMEPEPPNLDISRLKEDLDMYPRSLSEGLDRVLTWQDNQRAMRSMMGVTNMPWM